MLSYLDCCENAYLEYEKRVEGVDYAKSFSYLAFHTPFGGMIKGAHRNLMRKMVQVASTIDHGNFETPQRIGCFSYGSGCCSEFFSGVVRKEGQERLRAFNIREQLDRRYELSMEEYDDLLVGSNAIKFGTRNVVLDSDFIPQARKAQGKETLFLKEIREFHGEYEWVA